MRRAAWFLLLVFVFFLPLEKSFQFAGIGTISRPLGLLVLALTLISVAAGGRLRLRRPSYFLVVLLLFVLWNILGLFWTIDLAVTLDRIETYLQLLVMVWLLWQLARSDDERLALYQAYICGALVSTTTALMNFLAGNTQGEWLRFAGTGFDPNDFATTLALGIPIAWHLATTQRLRWFYWLNLLYVPWVLFINILTSSRAGLVLSLLSLAIIPLTYGALSLRRKLAFTTLLVVLATLPMFEVVPNIYEQIAPNLNRLSTLSSEVTTGDFNYRTVIWQAGLELFGQRPLLGVGSGTFPQAAAPMLDRARRPHNAYLAVLAENGIIGLLLFLALFAIAAWPVLQAGIGHRAFHLVLLLTLMVGLMPLNWETRKPTYFLLAMFTIHRAFVVEPEHTAAPAAGELQPGSGA